MMIYNEAGADNFLRIDGSHNNGRGDRDVVVVRGIERSTRNIPVNHLFGAKI